MNQTGTSLTYALRIEHFGGDDYGNGVAVDAAGNAYIVGSSHSDSADSFGSGGRVWAKKVGWDAYVTKINAAGNQRIGFATIAGDDDDYGTAMTVDGAGNMYVTGITYSNDWGGKKVGPSLTHNGDQDAFIAKIKADFSDTDYAGYIGGADADGALGVTVDAGGNAYVTGYTASPQASFPVTIGPDLTFNGGVDAFVAKVASGGALVYAGYIGGNDDDSGTGIALDVKGNAIVTGVTYSTEASFPATQGADVSFNGVADVFVAKVSGAGGALVYSGYVGGDSDEEGHAVAVDASGSVYVTGLTASAQTSFQTAGGADTSFNGGVDAYVVKFGCAPLMINTQPATQTACVGGSVSFTVAVNTPDGASYQWRKDGVPINNATASTYTIPLVTAGRAGVYDVIVNGLCESLTSDPATLAVETLPLVILNPGSQAVASGQGVAFAAAATSNTAMTTQWQVSTNNGASFMNISGANAAALSLPPVTTAQDGQLFRAAFTNVCSTAYTAAARLTVIGTVAGNNVTVQTTVGTTTVSTTFSEVSQLGTTTVTPITPALVPDIPGSFTLQTDGAGQPMAYNIETQTQSTGPIHLCFQVNSVNDPNQ